MKQIQAEVYSMEFPYVVYQIQISCLHYTCVNMDSFSKHISDEKY